MKTSIFGRFARAFFIFWHFEDVLVLSKTWNDLFCSCVDDVSICWQMFNFVFFQDSQNSFFKQNDFKYLKNDCKNAKFHFQITFSFPSTSCLLKLPTFCWGSERDEDFCVLSEFIIRIYRITSQKSEISRKTLIFTLLCHAAVYCLPLAVNVMLNLSTYIFVLRHIQICKYRICAM